MNKQSIQRVFVVSLALVFLVGCPGPPATVTQVDIDRYLGLWYQVAGYPFFATDDLVGITAEYSLLENGNVQVLNKGFVGSFDGPLDTIVGEARVVDPATNAKLAVRFPEVLGGIFEGEYWIIRLDEVDYNYAVVSDSLRMTLFILSRTPTMEESVLNELLDSLAEDGFDISRVNLIPQQ